MGANFFKEQRRKAVVLVDMDKTLVAADTANLWMQFLFEKKFIGQAELSQRQIFGEQYKNGCLDLRENFRFEFKLLEKIPQETRLIWQREFLKTKVLPKLQDLGVNLIHAHLSAGDSVILITGGISFIAKPLAEYLGITCIATGPEINKFGQYTGELQGEACVGEGKLRRYQAWAKEHQREGDSFTVYTDSINDLPIMQAAGRAVAVNPDKELQKIAQIDNWEIEDWNFVPEFALTAACG